MRRTALGLAALGILGLAPGLAARAEAQAERPCPRCTLIGDGPDALPGIYDVPIATLAPPLSGAITGSGGIGFSVDEIWPSSTRIRLHGMVAGSIHVLDWLAIGASIRGRWETIDRQGASGDTGLVGYPTITVRATTEPVAGLGLALDFATWMYGGEAPSLEPASTSLRARGVVSYRIAAGEVTVTLTGAGGLLLDNSRAAAPLAVTAALSEEDRLSLGVSDFSAVQVGVGAAVRYRFIEVAGEIADRILVGSGAPDFGRSPLHITLGARVRPAGEVFEVGLFVDVRASEAAPAMIAMDGPNSPIDPMLGVHLTISGRIGLGAPPPVDEVDVPVVVPDHVPDHVAPPTTGRVSGRVVDDAGAPVAGAGIELVPADAPPLTTTSDADGRWEFESAPRGSARLIVRAPGHDPVEQTIEIGATAVEVPTALPATLPRGEIRGVIQGFDGRPLQAEVRISPLGLDLTCDADGAFEAVVPPGEYDLEVRAPGHRSQSRHVEVEEHGVVVLNAQLRRAREH